ncbi:MAG: patatin-like phospholipase family protein [Vicinamibacterales bacterium]
MTGTPLTWTEVLLAEYEALHGPLTAEDRERLLRRADASPEARRAAIGSLNTLAFGSGQSALCLSGGGVRSASFSVGVLQTFARLGILRRFDYLSTVSGGGFAGAWLTAWLRRAQDDPAARRQLERLEGTRGEDPTAVEPEPLVQLRKYIRYMSPHEGFFSADVWALAATMTRNMVVNWLVVVPAIAAALLIPRLHYSLIRLADENYVPGVRFGWREPETWVLLLVAALMTSVLAYAAADLPSVGNARRPQGAFVKLCLLPLALGTLGLTYFWTIDRVPLTLSSVLIACCGGQLVAWSAIALWLGRGKLGPRASIAGAIAGVIPALGMWWMMQVLFPNGVELEAFYVSTAYPMLLALVLLGGYIFVGIAGSEFETGDLEWWSRFGAWVMIAAVAWLSASAVIFGGPQLFASARDTIGELLNLRSAHASAVTALLTPALGAAAASLSRTNPGRGSGSLVRQTGGAMVAPAFVITLLATVSWADELLVEMLKGTTFVSSLVSTPREAGLLSVVLLGAALAMTGVFTSRMVPVNKFSLSGMYRQRLIRAFVGASRSHRSPNPFTGFDPADDLPLHDLSSVRPLHVVNATLNMVGERRLGQQERKAEPFTFSPLHAGAAAAGYRPADRFGADPVSHTGISLGAAITISGAAASPSMGMFSTPATTFLMTLLNARLGSWVGNPGPAGSATWQHAEPNRGALLMLDELVGRTTATRPYVYLSDGGHFDNLGLVEMVRRRCRFIAVVDGGADPDYRFDDLANAVRRIRIDLGVRIDIDGIDMSLARQGSGNPHCLVGTIHYDGVDGHSAVGTLVYMKPCLSGDEPSDVRNYAAAHPLFPHQSTANQWFSEAQFESYRMLGVHTAEAVAGVAKTDGADVTPLSVPEFCAAALAYRQKLWTGTPSVAESSRT